MMLRKKNETLEWLEFELLTDIPKLHHAVFMKHGGFSRGPYQSLNTSYSVRDDSDCVTQNLDKISTFHRESIIGWQRSIFGKACHGAFVSAVNSTSPEIVENCDGLMTGFPKTTLRMTHADCQVALFYDPIHKVIANVHAGWKGSVQNIYRETLEKMRALWGSQTADVLVCITPSLGPQHAEFKEYRTELPEEFWTFQVRPNYFDFWAIAEFQLKNEGILTEHIDIARQCTFQEANDFFSYRRDKITGRHSTCITLT